MRNVLFVLEPIGTGKAWRALAIAEQLHELFPAIAPHFLANPAAAVLLRAAGRFPVEDTLAPILPVRTAIESGDDESLARALGEERRRLAPSHARETLRVARALHAELVVVDGLFAAPPVLSRAGFAVSFLTDRFDDEPTDGRFRRASAALLQRAVVATTKFRFFIGEPSYLASPELRVWSRKYFRYTGPIAALARLRVRECATLRDDLGLGSKRLVVVATGSAFAGPHLARALEGVQAAAAGRDDVVVKTFFGTELALDSGAVEPTETVPPAELPHYLAIADACVISGGLSLLSECAGLRVPTLALPLRGDPLQARRVDYFAHRFGVTRLDEPTRESLRVDAVAAKVRELLEQPELHRPHDAPDADDHHRNAGFVADLLAEALGRRRPEG
jgi:hypothetical protein